LDMRVRVQAAGDILARAFGRPAQAPTLPTYLSVEDLERLIEKSTGENPRDRVYPSSSRGYPER
jgi:hypothetical protein